MISNAAAYALRTQSVDIDVDQLWLDSVAAEQLADDDKQLQAVLTSLVMLKHMSDELNTWDAATRRALELLQTVARRESVHLLKKSLAEAGTRAERRVGRKSAQHFRRCVRETAGNIAELTIELDPRRAAEQAEEIMRVVFDDEQWLEDLQTTIAEPLAESFAAGAMTELRLTSAVLSAKLTSAEEIAARLQIPVPAGVTISQMPQWMLDAARDAVRETMQEPYWQQVVQTTRDDIKKTLTEGVEDGLSIREVAKRIATQNGTAYSLMRATRVARTETPNMLNAGHAEGIKQLAQETGEQLGKEWLSVLGNTTRKDHAALDGAQTTADGTFVLGGVEVPWPAHRSLPAHQRINCQCTIISSVLMEAIEGGDAVEPDDDDALADMPVDKIINGNSELEKKRQKVLKITRDTDAEIKRRSKEENELALQYIDAQDEWSEAVDREIENPSDATRERVRLANQKVAELERQVETFELEIAVLRAKQNDKIMRALAVSTDKRGKWSLTKNTRGTFERSDDDLRVSTGKFTPEWNRKMAEARKFYQRLANTKGVEESHLQFAGHIQEKGSRAFHRGVNDTRFAARPRDWGVYATARAPTETYVHEIGHHFEAQVPGVEKRANEFIDYRIAKFGKPNTNLHKELSDRYGEDEVGNDDGFAPLWERLMGGPLATRSKSGVHSRAFYNGKRYESGHTEVISMGMEALYMDPAGFAEADPEYFRFMLGVLDGTVR